MVLLVVRLQALEDVHALVERGLLDVHFLEPTGQRAILLEMVAELVVGSRTDAAQLALGKDRLQEGRGVHRTAAGRAGTHDGVDFVDEQDRARYLFDGLDHGLDAAFKIAPIARPGEHSPEIKGEYPRVLEFRGHVALDDAQGEPFGDGRLARAGIAHIERVVLAPPGQNLDGA